MDLPNINHAKQQRLPSVIKQLDLCLKGEQRMTFVWTVARFSSLYPTIFFCLNWVVMVRMGRE